MVNDQESIGNKGDAAVRTDLVAGSCRDYGREFTVRSKSSAKPTSNHQPPLPIAG